MNLNTSRREMEKKKKKKEKKKRKKRRYFVSILERRHRILCRRCQ